MIGVIGAGKVGKQLVAKLLLCNVPVVLVSRLLDESKTRNDIRKLVGVYGKYLKINTIDIVSNLNTKLLLTDKYSLLSGAECVFECVIEDMDVKKTVIEKANVYNDIVASTTSSFTCKQLSDCGCRCSIVHVFNPVPLSPVVECVFENGHAETVLTDILSRLGISPVKVPDISGFVVNKLLFAMYNEAVELVKKGLIDEKSVDILMTLAARQAKGPFATMEMIGSDVSNAIFKSLGYKQERSTKITATIVNRAPVAG